MIFVSRVRGLVSRTSRGPAMTKSQLLQTYKRMSVDERRELNRWANANAVFGSIVAAALITMAVMGSWFSDTGSVNVMVSQPGAGPCKRVALALSSKNIS